MKKLRFVSLNAIAVLACFGITGPAGADESSLARGAELLQPFKMNLKQALLNGLQDGPEHAVDVCKDKAPAIAKDLSVNDVTMGRSSHRLRNPSNRAPEWVAPILETYVDDDSSRKPVAVPLPGKRIGYVEPIVMQPLCEVCHGSSVAPDVQAGLERQYPSDQAIGFHVGDLRGVFWVDFPASETVTGEERPRRN